MLHQASHFRFRSRKWLDSDFKLGHWHDVVKGRMRSNSTQADRGDLVSGSSTQTQRGVHILDELNLEIGRGNVAIVYVVCVLCIDLRSRILDLAALDLHVLTNKGHDKGYGTDAGEVDWVDEMGMGVQPFREMSQSHLRIIELVQSLCFDWSDSLTTTAHADKLNTETGYILESCAIGNHRRQVVHTVVTGYEARRRLLDMTLTKCFHRLRHDRRGNIVRPAARVTWESLDARCSTLVHLL